MKHKKLIFITKANTYYERTLIQPFSRSPRDITVFIEKRYGMNTLLFVGNDELEVNYEKINRNNTCPCFSG
jgi:hypothetical protein